MDYPSPLGADLHEVRDGGHDGRPARIVGSCVNLTDPDDLWGALTNRPGELDNG